MNLQIHQLCRGLLPSHLSSTFQHTDPRPLKVPHTIRATGFTKSPEGKILEVQAHYENDIPFKKPKTYIQWIAHAPEKGSPVPIEVRQTNPLFLSENPLDCVRDFEEADGFPGGETEVVL